MSFSYELQSETLGADEDGVQSFQFYLVKGDEKLCLGRSALASKGVYQHATGWSSQSPNLKQFLQENVAYRPSDVVIATFPK